MRAVMYARVSTDHRDQLNSLDNQMKSYSQVCSEMGWEQTDVGAFYKKSGRLFEKEYTQGVYADEGTTATSMKKREAFKLMIKDAREGKFDLIFTKSVARFGRSVEDTSKTVKDLKELGIGVYFMDLKVNSLDSSKEFMINLFASLAQQESNDKSYIVQFGKRKSMESGRWVTGITPFGYDLADKFLRINEREASVVREIYRLYYNEGWGTGRIVRHLNANNIPTKKGTLWSQIQVSRILDNQIYTGKQIQHMTRTIDVNRQIKENVPEDEWITHQFDHLIIIPPDLFRLVQIEKQNRLDLFGQVVSEDKKYVDENDEIQIQKKRILKRNDKRYSSIHLFSNLLVCHTCGNTLKRKKRNGKEKDLGHEWCCRINDMYGKAKCPSRSSIPEDILIREVKKEVSEWKETSHKLFYKLYIAAKYTSYKDSDLTIIELNQQLSDLQKRRDKNFNLYDEDIIGIDEYKKRNDTIQYEIDHVNKQIFDIKNIDKAMEETNLRYQEYLKTLESIDVESMMNVDLRKIVDQICIVQYYEPLDGNQRNYDIMNWRDINIEFKFMGKDASNVIREIKAKQDEIGLERWTSLFKPPFI